METGLKKYRKKFTGIWAWIRKKILIIDPERNWETLVIIFIIVIIIIVGYSFLLFYRVSSDEAYLSESSEEIPAQTVDRGQLKEILENYRLKEGRFESYKNEPPIIPNPF